MRRFLRASGNLRIEGALMWKSVATGLLLAGALLSSGCDQSSPTAADKSKPVAAAPLTVVTVSQPVADDVIEWDEYTARFDAIESVEVRARVSGYLDQIAFTDGQKIKKGDLLFVIDPRPFERALDQARAELEQAKTKTENANLDVERGKPLVERRVMSEKAYDDRANLLREALAAVKVAEAKVASADLDLSFTRIYSPIEGLIGRTLVTKGNWVNAGTISTASSLTTIVTQDPIYLYFDVSENNFLKYKRLTERGEKTGAGQAGGVIEFAMSDDKGFPHKGVLDFIDNRIDAGTATIRARAKVDNKKGFFSPGMFARARIAGSARYKGRLVPDQAISSDQASKFLLVVGSDNTVARRAVKLGPLHNGLRLVREGVEADEWVIVKGRARPGQKVELKKEQVKLSDVPSLSPAGASPQVKPN